MTDIIWSILMLAALGYVSFKAARYFKLRRYGYGVGMSVLALILAYQIIGLWQARPPAAPPPAAPAQTQPSGSPADRLPSLSAPPDADSPPQAQ